MRIVVHGQQAFGCSVLEKLLERKEDVVAVCTAPDKDGRPMDPLKVLALENGLPVHQPASWKTPEALALMQSFNADICMMAYVLLFVPEAVRDAPTLGSFQYHPSLLPMHRGPSSINWPIAMGSTKTGLSIFWPNDGLDEGPILMQKTCEIGADETLGDVYFKKLFPMGVDAMIESLDLVKEGNAPRIEQSIEEGSYESWFGKKEAKIDWNQSAQHIYNTIRAGNPQPGAWTIHGDTELKIFDAEVTSESGQPGLVLGIDDEGFTVAASDYSIRIKRVRADAGKVPAPDYVASSGLAIDDVLGN
ncbi:MAG: methionyl-tRNA formyltransferase [Gammaproteobacteria bacterium]|nr:methionyl-tRNA formyltransferase [Gammaproteobacteria bacterium]